MYKDAADNKKGSTRLRINFWSWVLVVAWSMAVITSVSWNIHQVRSHVMEQARHDLRTNFYKDLALRQWATGHGGVYVPVTQSIQPDPYTDFLPERDVVTPSGRLLTLLNPATIMRQYYELSAQGDGARGHITSLHPLNPANTPDPWESEALRAFEAGKEEVSELVDMDGSPHMRLIRPMIIEEECLTCHGRQGYRAGDVGGGISVTVELDTSHARHEVITLGIGHGLLWVFGLVGIGGGSRQLARRVRDNERAYQALEENQERTRAILSTALDAIITIDADNHITGWNEQAEAIFGWRADEVRGQTLSETIIPERYRAAHDEALQRVRHGGERRMLGRRVELSALDRTGREFPVELAVASIVIDGSFAFSAFIRDITERKETESKIRRDYHSQRTIAAVLETSMMPLPFGERLERILDLILSTPWLSLQGKGIIFVADGEQRNLQLAAQRGTSEAVTNTCTNVPFGECICGRVAESRTLIFSACIDHQHDRTFPDMVEHGHYALPILSGGKLLGVLNLYLNEGHRQKEDEIQFLSAVAHTIGGMIQRHQAEELLQYNAYHDQLTDLPNRALFMDRLDRCIKRAERHPEYLFAVLFLDLDRFKNVNDSLGHGAGDGLLVGLAGRLLDCMRPGDTVGRLGGDEFTILLDDISDVAAAARIAERIHEELRNPFEVDGREVFAPVSIGIAIGSAGRYSHPEELLRDADTAMYRAKLGDPSNGHTAVFDDHMHARAVKRLNIEMELRRAVERREFQVYYQPIIDIDSGEILGLEALVRWQQPERGMVSPVDFIPVAEETGLIGLIGKQVLTTACEQLSRWQERLIGQSPYVSINLSARQFLQPGLVEEIESALKSSGLDPSSLRLEITESVLVENPDTTNAILQQFKRLGIRLYIDDFGTGYSSLSYLHNFPFDTLKVDRSFVAKLGDGEEHEGMVQAIIAIAGNFGMDVIAEGVETREQLEQLRRLGCRHVQGYYFAPPLPPEALEEYLGRPLGPAGDAAG